MISITGSSQTTNMYKLVICSWLLVKIFSWILEFWILIQVTCSDKANDYFSPSKIKKWALDDLNQTVSWLESQDEKVRKCLTYTDSQHDDIACLSSLDCSNMLSSL